MRMGNRPQCAMCHARFALYQDDKMTIKPTRGSRSPFAPDVASALAIALAMTIALAMAGAFAPRAALAQDYPTRPVKIIAPSTPGGGFDLVGRVLAHKLGEQTGQQFVVENRPGSGTLLGSQAAARAVADGYTLLVGGLSNIALNMGMYKDPGYDALTDLVPISLVVAHSYIMVGRKDLPHANLQEVFAFARANPGKLTIATSGPGTGQFVGASIIIALAGIDILKVPYKGAQPAYQDLLSGRVDLFYDNTTTAQAYIDTQRVKPLGLASRARTPALPDVPTIAETKVLDWEMESWFGLFAPARTPRPIIEKLRAEIDKAMESAEVRTRLQQGSGRILRLTPAQTDTLVKTEVAKWVALVKKVGVTAE